MLSHHLHPVTQSAGISVNLRPPEFESTPSRLRIRHHLPPCDTFDSSPVSHNSSLFKYISGHAWARFPRPRLCVWDNAARKHDRRKFGETHHGGWRKGFGHEVEQSAGLALNGKVFISFPSMHEQKRKIWNGTKHLTVLRTRWWLRLPPFCVKPSSRRFKRRSVRPVISGRKDHVPHNRMRKWLLFPYCSVVWKELLVSGVKIKKKQRQKTKAGDGGVNGQ